MRRVLQAALVASWAAASATVLSGQAAQRPVFRSATQHVAVDVIVTDSRGRPVTDLRQDDFVVSVGGKRQTIADFQYVSIPASDRAIDLDAPTRPPTDVAWNADASASSRAFVFVVDDMHIAPSALVPLKRLLGATLRTLGPGDQAALVYTSRSDISQDFTTDIDRLIDAANNRRKAVGGFSIDPQKSLMVVLRNVVKTLSTSRHARRAVFLIGSNGCSPVYTPGNDRWEECLDLVHKAWEADVPFYVLNPNLFTGADSSLLSAGSLDDHAAAVTADSASREDMATLAGATGGGFMSGAANPAQAAAKLIAENDSYYLLGIYPEPVETDGKFHEIKVTVTRPGLRVRARRGYMAPGGPPKPMTANREMTGELGAGLDDPSLPIRAFAAPIAAAPKGKTRTLVTIEVQYPVLAPGVRAVDDDLRVGILALTPDGKIKASFQRPIKITGTWTEMARDGRLVANEVIDLPSDKLVLRVGVTSHALGKSGTTHLTVEPPDFTGKHLQMSGVVIGLADSRAARADAAMGLASLDGVVPFQPVTDRTFAGDATLRLYAHVTWGSNVPQAAIRASVAGGPSSPSTVSVVDGRKNSSGRYEADVTLSLPLGGLPAGDYVLRMEAAQPGEKGAARVVPFSVK